jgi:pantoate--beta-alanine ligase
VATIVKRLFEIVQPDRAYFGAKDWQQTLVVRDLASSRGGPSIVVCSTAREPSGLALSSRNERLSALGRERAASLYRALCRARDAWRSGERGGEELSALMRAELQREGIEVEYATVRDPEGWTAGPPVSPLERAIGLVAARVEGVRLIDNLRFDRP